MNRLSPELIKSYAGQRRKMVEEQLVERGVKDLSLLEVMSRVPRHLFAQESLRHRAYGDTPLPIGENQTLSQPYIVGAMTEALDLKGEERVLEIGTGFMMITRKVFDDFREAFPQFAYRPDHNRSEHFTGDRLIHAYFDTVIDSKEYLGEISDNSERYLSEDYFFCQFVRKLGYQIFLCPWMKLGHMGSYVFSGSMGSLANLEFASHGADPARVSSHEKRRKNKNKKKRK